MEHEISLVAQPTAGQGVPAQNPMANRKAFGLGPYAGFINVTKRIYTSENARATRYGNVGLAVKPYQEWDTEYMTQLFLAHPEAASVFADIAVRATWLVGKKDYAPRNIQAINAIEELTGSDPRKIIQFMTMIRDASAEVERRERAGIPNPYRQQSYSPSVPADTLRQQGVRLESSDTNEILSMSLPRDIAALQAARRVG